MIHKNLFSTNDTLKECIIFSILIGFSVYVLLIIYQPYGTNEFQNNYKYLLLFPYAIIFTISSIAASFCFRKSAKYTVLTEIKKNIVILLTSSFLSYFYNTIFLSKVDFSIENFFYMIAYVFAIGTPVMVIYALVQYIYLNPKLHSNDDTETIEGEQNGLTVKINEISDELSKTLKITSDYGNYILEIKEDDFIYAEAADNYCIIFFYAEGIVCKEMIRTSLAKLFGQIQTSNIKQIHRSFIVNLKKVANYKGNTSAYKINMKDIENELTVSRNYVASIIPVIKNLVTHP